jgi:ketosteroid isomerase-like protein
MRVFLLLGLLTLSLFSRAQTQDEVAIRLMLGKQVEAWNKGQIEGYMHGYWEDDSLLFIGKNGPVYGYAQTLARYKKAYPDTDAMGKLTSEIKSLTRLSQDYFFAVGLWSLSRKGGDLSGSWTLLIRHIGSNWVIVADHSS